MIKRLTSTAILLFLSLSVLAAPVPPSGLSAVKTGDDVTLNWNDNPETDIFAYGVYYSDTAGGPYTKLDLVYNTTQYIDDNVDPGARYYVVIAHNPSGASDYSNEVVAGNRVPLHRYWNNNITDHFYTTDFEALGAGGDGWTYEGVACYVEPEQTVGSVQWDRWWNDHNTSHFYTINANFNDPGWEYEGYEGFVYPYQISYSVPLYHYHNSVLADHFYTTDWNVFGAGSGDWVYQGVAAYVFTSP